MIPLASEIDDRLDYILRRWGAEKYLSLTKQNGFTTGEVYHFLKRCEAEHLDPDTGRPASQQPSDNRDDVYALLDKTEKKINGERKLIVSNTSQNYLTILRNDERFQNIKFNTLRGLPEKIVDGKARQWTDADDAAARTYIESCYGISNRQKCEDAFTEFQHEREYDPVQTLINGIEWDGTPRVETMLIRWMGAEDTPYNRECSRLLFAGGINRAFRPGCKNDNVIVLVGAQGGGKSTFTQWLALSPELYSSTKTINGQKGLEAISGKWICELEELLATLANDYSGTKSEENAKAFLSTSSDFYRKPYDRRPTDSPRHCIFIGTTNRETFLTDKTGNRRWYPVRVDVDGRWLYEHEEECKADILQAWAEMKHAFDNGLPLAKPVADVALLSTIKEEQAAAEQDDWRVGLVEQYLDGKEKVCLIEVWQRALYPDRSPYYPEMTRRDAYALSAIICNKLGWVRGNVSDFGDYGRQKSFYKEPPKIDFEPL
ncbi:virulence-associated E family protein [Selenomonas ruminantium]|uniref:virulence-associated E family protein n=1 Tax=Selenomonas ruminantium TaxID=971 RepID=UPI001569ADC6|nr:virulence-associated E family protein [Selenomonas ruminantium]